LHSKKELDAAREKNRRAIKIVNDLAVGLDHEQGGDIARDLGWIYHSVMDQLKDMNGSQDGSMYDRLIRLFEGLRGAWEYVSLRNH
jgi:flagellin-specific chaperone FliS